MSDERKLSNDEIKRNTDGLNNPGLDDLLKVIENKFELALTAGKIAEKYEKRHKDVSNDLRSTTYALNEIKSCRLEYKSKDLLDDDMDDI